MSAAFEARGYEPRDDGVYVIYREPGRMIGRVALHDDRTLFLFVFATPGDDAAETLDLAAQKAILRRTYGSGKWECAAIFDRLDPATDLYFDRVDRIRMEAWSLSRVALVGDAAFCASLMAGQGAALAIAAAYVLAGELADAGARHGEAFGRYQSRLRDFIALKQRGARRFSAAFAPKTAFGMLVRNQVIRACALPGLANFVLAREIADRLQLPDYAWPAPASSRAGRAGDGQSFAPGPPGLRLDPALHLRFLRVSRKLRVMLRLFLVRHAKAEAAAAGDDFERTLVDRGRADARRMAVALLARGMLPDLLIHSGAARAKETAEILAAEWSGKVELQEERGLYNASQASLLTRARALSDSLVRAGFVGHNPGLGDLAVSLPGSGERAELRRMAAKFPTCGVAALDFSVRHWGKIKSGSARLSLFLTPSELKADKG